MVDQIRIDDKALLRLIKQAIKAGQDLRPWFRSDLDKSVTKLLKRHFMSKGSYGGTPWAPLKPSTMLARIRPGHNRGGVNHPLWDTGALKASLLMPGSEGYLRAMTRVSYERGTSIPYARYHQHGVSARKIPRRPIIPEPPTSVIQEWERSLAKWLERQL